jgi:rhodanese-related sulfurtransferase
MGLFTKSNTISAQEAHERIGQGGKLVVLDVRTPAEFRQIRIPGAKLLPVDEIGSRAAAELPDKETPILIYCQSGIRAETAVKQLLRMGYTGVASFGCIMSWPYETERG